MNNKQEIIVGAPTLNIQTFEHLVSECKPPVDAQEFTTLYPEEVQEFFNNDRSIFHAPLKSNTPTYKDFE